MTDSPPTRRFDGIEPSLRQTRQVLNNLVEAIRAKASESMEVEVWDSLREAEKVLDHGFAADDCPDCGRRYMTEPQMGSGFLTPCGRRLTRIEQCGAEGGCKRDGQ